MSRGLGRLVAGALWLALAGSAAASGTAEDPSEVLVRTWTWDRVTTLEVRGQVTLTVKPGPEPRLTVETTRALFDQLSVSNWWGWAAVKVETGLQGPREVGAVKVTLEVPSLQSLAVADRSSAVVDWPGAAGALQVWERSTAEVRLEGGIVRVEASWRSAVVLKGRVDRIEAALKQESEVDARDLETGEAEVRVELSSVYRAGPTGAGTGVVRRQGRIDRDPASSWSIQGPTPD